MTGPTNKSKERKLEIMRAAQQLFNTRGFNETSINDIMKRAGGAKGAFYYYFTTKDDILCTLVDQNIEEIAAAMRAVSQKTKIDPIQKLKLMLLEELRISAKSNEYQSHLHNIKNVDMHQRIMIAMVEKLAPVIGEVVRQGVDEGAFKTEYPLEVSELIITGVHFIIDLGIFNWNNSQYMKRVKASAELIEKSLGIEAGTFDFLESMLEGTPDRIKKGNEV